MPVSRYVVALTLFLCFAGESRAGFLPGLTVDRANQFFNQSLNYSAFTPIGESFTPTLDGIQWAAFGMQDFTTTGTGVFDIELFQGVGTTGLNLTFGEGILTVPEPTTFTLLGIAVVCVACVARRKRR